MAIAIINAKKAVLYAKFDMFQTLNLYFLVCICYRKRFVKNNHTHMLATELVIFISKC